MSYGMVWLDYDSDYVMIWFDYDMIWFDLYDDIMIFDMIYFI